MVKEKLCNLLEYPGIDSWVQSWVSLVEPGLPRNTHLLNQENAAKLGSLIFLMCV